jgi:hypothetical protein
MGSNPIARFAKRTSQTEVRFLLPYRFSSASRRSKPT